MGRLTQAMEECTVAQIMETLAVPPHSVQMTPESNSNIDGSGEKFQRLTSLGMKDDPSVTRDQKAMPPHMRYFRLYLSPR